MNKFKAPDYFSGAFFINIPYFILKRSNFFVIGLCKTSMNTRFEIIYSSIIGSEAVTYDAYLISEKVLSELNVVYKSIVREKRTPEIAENNNSTNLFFILNIPARNPIKPQENI